MERSLDQALAGTLAILTKVRPEDLDSPTPCASWDVRALINHFVGSARWWAATISEDGDVTEADYAAGDFVAAYEESIRTAATAFGADGALAKTIQLPFGEFPGTVLLNLATMEQFTHAGFCARYRAASGSGSRARRRTAQRREAGDQ